MATDRVTKERGLPVSHVAGCETLAPEHSPRDYYITSLNAYCHEDICGSTNMGWFAVRKSTGEVFEWDVAEGKQGRLLRRRP